MLRLEARAAWLGVVLAVLAAAGSASAAADLSVRVVDAVTGAPLAAATVTVDGRTLAAGADGRCALDLGPGSWPLEVRAPGYADRRVVVQVTGTGPDAFEVALVPRGRFREHVDVAAPTEAAAEPVKIPVKPTDVVGVAGGIENVFRVLQTLPGVASPEEFSSRISVRGGGPDENLTVMDGVEIHNPYRLFGLVSAFNPETVEEFELSAGGFGVRHGDRLSSLLVVNNRAGSRERAVTGSTALSLTDGNLIVEGRTPKGSGSWLLTGRRTYYDLVAERFTDSDLPSFGDLQGKTVWSFPHGRRLAVFGLLSREATDASFDVPEEGAEGAIVTRSRNDLVAAAFETSFAGRGLSRTTVSAYTNADSADFGGDFRNTARRTNLPGDEAFDRSRVEITWDGEVKDHALRHELSLQARTRHVFDAGFELHRLRTRISFTIPGERNPTEANGSSLAGGAALPDVLDSVRTDTRIGAWLQDRIQVASRLSVEAGLRLDRSTVNARTSVSPRLSATYALTPSTRLRASWGQYTQTPGYEKLVQADYFADLSGAGPLPLANEQARHAVLGLERDLPGGVLARLEAYHKGFDRLVVGRLETAEETAARVGQYDFPADLADAIPREPWITTTPVNDGRGRAYGFDVYVSRRATSADTRLSGWASYSYGRAERDAYGRTFPFDYDRRHAVSLVGSLRLGRKLELAATVRYASGFPRTPGVGVRVAAAPDALDLDGDGDREELVPQRDAAGRLFYTVDLGGIDNLNTARLPSYARVDTRLSFKPGGPSGRVKLYLDVINVLNRSNAGFPEFDLEYDPTSDHPRLVEHAEGGIPFLPSFGVHVNWAGSSGRKASPGSSAPGVPERPQVLRPWAVSLRPVGTQGVGLELTRGLARRWNARAAVNVPSTFSFDKSATETDYRFDLALGGLQALVDWHPLDGGFHLSGGLLRTRHRFSIHDTEDEQLEIGGDVYAREDVGTLTGEGRVRRWAPYAGLGWGNALGKGKRWGLVLDLGVAFQGRPQVTLAASSPASEAGGLRDSLDREAREIAARLDGWRTFPIIALSLSRRF